MNPYAAACFALSAGLKVAVALSLLFASGCGPQGPLASVKPGIGFAGRVAVVDADLQAVRNFQPVLPDDLGKPDSGTAPQPKVETVQPIIIIVYAPSWCSGCKPMKAEVKNIKLFLTPDDAPLRAFTFRFVEAEKDFPLWVREGIATGKQYPVLHWNSLANGPRVRYGWAGFGDFLKAFDRYEKPISSAAKSKVAYGYPTRGNHWSFPGHSRRDIIDHLDDGQHRGKFDRAWLETLTYEQLLSLHDSDHEGRVAWGYVQRPVRSFPKQQRAAIRAYRACPDCPTL